MNTIIRSISKKTNKIVVRYASSKKGATKIQTSTAASSPPSATTNGSSESKPQQHQHQHQHQHQQDQQQKQPQQYKKSAPSLFTEDSPLDDMFSNSGMMKIPNLSGLPLMNVFDSMMMNPTFRMDYYETKDSYHVDVDCPGYSEKTIECTYTKKGTINVKGKKESKYSDSNDDGSTDEVTKEHFYRSIKLPNDADVSKIDAKLQDGILYIVAPKIQANQVKEDEYPIKIPIVNTSE